MSRRMLLVIGMGLLALGISVPAAAQSSNDQVRVIHASPDAPAVAVKVASGSTLIESLAFPNASDYLPVDAGTYDLQVTPAGADAVVLNQANTQLQAGTIFDVVAVGQLSSISAKVATFTPQAATSGAAGSPNTLPTTGAGDTLWLVVLALGVLALVGGLVVRHRVA